MFILAGTTDRIAPASIDGEPKMSFYDADDFDEEYLDDEDEEANAFEVTMAAVFEGYGDDSEAGLISARANAEESIYDGEWELSDGKLVAEPDASGRTYFEFMAVTVVEADSVEEAIDIASSSVSDDWELVGEPTPFYLDFDE
jgi:hypothetical protein